MNRSESISQVGKWTISEVDETGSTNDDLLAAAARGEVSSRTALRTDHQTAGRGRLDRTWEAPPGSNLLASVYVTGFDDSPAVAVQRIGVALIDAIEQLTPPEVVLPGLGLKWPNDVLLGGQKLAGVLSQRSSGCPGIVVGFGVNVGWSPDGAARLSQYFDCSPADLLAGVVGSFDALPVADDELTQRYRNCLLTLGQRVRVHLPGGDAFVGVATDIDGEGRIVVTSDVAEVRVFDVGDVVHLRPDGP